MEIADKAWVNNCFPIDESKICSKGPRKRVDLRPCVKKYGGFYNGEKTNRIPLEDETSNKRGGRSFVKDWTTHRGCCFRRH